jgi:hypothetical protein
MNRTWKTSATPSKTKAMNRGFIEEGEELQTRHGKHIQQSNSRKLPQS